MKILRPKIIGVCPYLFYLLAVFVLSWAVACYANPEIVTFVSPIVYRGDGQGDYLFKEGGKFSGTRIADDGSIEYVSSPGTYEIVTPYTADGLILNLAANWVFSGKVKLEVSITGNSADYIPVINGVPLEPATMGSKIKWRATLAPGSKLTEVKITYKDITGIAGSWGNPKLTSFNFKKQIQITGSSSDELFNFPVPIKIGESLKATDCDVKLKGVVQSGFDDVRFTCADSETALPYYLESVSGKAGERVALLWVKIPQLPKEGLIIYLYYGKLAPELLSDPAQVFEFYYDFTDSVFDDKKWEAADLDDGVIEYIQGSGDEIKMLDRETYDTKEKIIEFFKAGKDFKWVRNRKSANTLPTPAVGKEETAGLSEEIPNLPEFVNTAVAPNGDLTFAECATLGRYTSLAMFSDFKARILVPEWSEDAATGGSLSVAVAADGKTYKDGCKSENYYYASKGDFAQGSVIRWQVDLSRQDKSASSGRLKEFTIDFRPGTISVVFPDGREKLKAGDKYDIQWSALEYEPSYVMGIAYSADAGKNYKDISAGALNTGKSAWTAPEEFSQECLIKVYDKLGPLVYDTSNSYFSIGEEEDLTGIGEQMTEDRGQMTEEEEAEAEAEAETGVETGASEKAGIGLYELAIKIGSDPKKGNTSYKEGDIVLIRPAGYIWGAEEREKFLIVKAYLSEKEASELMMPKKSPDGEIIARRRYKIDITKQGIKKKLSEMLKSKPFVDIGEVEEK